MKIRNSILISIILLVQLLTLKSQTLTLPDSLMIYVPFNGTISGKCKMIDRYDQGYKLVGTDNKAGYFDGVDDMIQISQLQELNKVHYLTVSCWINPFSKKPWDSWVSKANNWNNNSQWRISFGEKPNQVELTIFNKDWVNYVFVDTLENKKWYHILYLIDAVNLKTTAYINGEKVHSCDIGEINESYGPLYIGFQRDDETYFHGLIDEVRVYNRLLEENEIQSLYDNFKNSEKAVYEEKIESYKYSKPKKLKDGMAVAQLDPQKCDTSYINRMMYELKNKKHGAIYSCLIMKDNYLVAEEYFNDITQDNKRNLCSATKSFASVLIGKAIELGYIKSDSDLIADYLPEVKALNLINGTEKIRIKDLLTMSSGINDSKIFWSNSVDTINHPVYIMKNQENINPGSKFLYKDIDAHVLAHVLNNATGLTLDQFAEKYLFKPMQIDSYLWYRNQCGIRSGCDGLCLTPRDFAKLGLLFINKGKWNNKQLINPEWIEKSITPRFAKTNHKNESYGYLWWMRSFKVKDKKIDCYLASGAKGQYLLIFPSQNLIICFTGNQALYRNWLNPLVSDFILPAFIK